MKPSKFKHPLRWYAENYHVSIATVKRWSVKGYNLDDPNSINLELLGQKHEPANFRPDPENPRSVAEVCATVLHQHSEKIAAVTRIIASGKRVEGCTKAQTIEGHVRLMLLLSENLWKATALAIAGNSLEQIKAEIEGEEEDGE